VAAFHEHVGVVRVACERALERAAAAGQRYDGVLFHSGSPGHYHADDQAWPFRTVPHFARWAPVAGPGHWLAFCPGERSRLVRFVPEDYWESAPDPSALPDETLEQVYDVVRVSDWEEARSVLGGATALAHWAYVGNDPALALAFGIGAAAVEPGALMSSLDWDRAFKTDYEVECVRQAAQTAARGHRAARDAAFRGESERAIHAAYLAAATLTENDTPYPNIVARDESAATLHYTGRRRKAPRAGASFLIDAGAPAAGYASDITRTYALDAAHPVFVALLEGMEAVQHDLVEAVAPGSYVALHLRAAHSVCSLLRQVGVLRLDPDAAVEREIDRCFLPHGLGHHLGLQVHDVGGHLGSPEGELLPPPERAPNLRTTRPLAPGHVVTIEPGVYFIPPLLAGLRAGPHADQVDWSLVDALRRHGGIRVEDDVYVTRDGGENLSRPFVPGATRA